MIVVYQTVLGFVLLAAFFGLLAGIQWLYGRYIKAYEERIMVVVGIVIVVGFALFVSWLLGSTIVKG